MEIQDIKTFLYIVREKSISAAAQAMFISQPAISARLDHLENELDAKLLDRGKGQRYVRLTPAGKEFLPIAEQWIELDNRTNRFIKRGHADSLSLISTGSVNEYIVPQIIRRVMQIDDFPRIQLATGSAEEIGGSVANGQSDIGLNVRFDDEHSEIVAIPLFEEVKYVLCPANTTLPDEPISPSQLDPAYEVVVTSISNKSKNWHNNWFSPLAEPYACVDLNHMSYHYLREPSCWTICPASIVMSLIEKHSELTYRVIEPAPPNRVIYFIRPREISAPMFDMIQTVEQVIYEYAESTPWLTAYPPEHIN